jgi:hypothetical protein
MLPVCWTRALLDWWRWSEVDFDGDWKQLLQTRALDATQAASLRTATYQGRPFGDARFVKALEARLARNLEPKPMGRPPKSRTAASRVAVRRTCPAVIWVTI